MPYPPTKCKMHHVWTLLPLGYQVIWVVGTLSCKVICLVFLFFFDKKITLITLSTHQGIGWSTCQSNAMKPLYKYIRGCNARSDLWWEHCLTRGNMLGFIIFLLKKHQFWPHFTLTEDLPMRSITCVSNRFFDRHGSCVPGNAKSWGA